MVQKTVTTMSILLMVIGITSSPLWSIEIFVPDDYPTIQGAINSAVNGDIVTVRPGTYVEYISFNSKAILVRSELGPHVTTIDGNKTASVVYFTGGENHDSILNGFTITNGIGTLVSGFHALFGAGIFCEDSSPTISNNVIKNNSVDDPYGGGGGIFCLDSSPLITGNAITENSPEGVLSLIEYSSSSSPKIIDNLIAQNQGMGLCCEGTPAIEYNRIIGNYDSGIVAYGATAVVRNNFISENSASYGGGFYCYNSSVTLINNTFYANSATKSGGGMNCDYWSDIKISNTILWGNIASEEGPEIAIYTNTDLEIRYSDVSGSQNSIYVHPGSTLNWGAGMIDDEPLFADAANADFHLTWNSPCRDTGDNSVVTELYDFEGDPRIALSTVDMGADEYYYHLYHTGDVVPGSPIDLKVVGYPSAPVLLALGSGIQNPPVSTQHGDLYLNWPPLWQGNIGTVPGDGVLVLNTTVPSSWTPGSEHPLQALVGPWGGSWTWLTNAEVLLVE